MAALVCTDCGQVYKAIAGHCRGGRWGGCCRSFYANRDFDAHRSGAFTPAARRCLSDTELGDRGWQHLGVFWASPGTVRAVQDAAAGVPPSRRTGSGGAGGVR